MEADTVISLRSRGRRAMPAAAGSNVVTPAAVACCVIFVAFLAGCTQDADQQSMAIGAASTNGSAAPSNMVLVPGGRFSMGDPKGEADETPHDVAVDSFYMDRAPVTQEMYKQVTGQNPSKRKSAANPVERMQWTDAVRFCNLCSEIEGLTPCYDLDTWRCDFEADGYRLPTEAEWEYACRAGSSDQYFFGDDAAALAKYAWCKPHSKGRPRAVGQKLPNGWGLHDMLGNVWEWCNDYYDPDYYKTSPRDNPRGPAAGKKRVLRGGAWNSPADRCRVSVRASEFQVFTDACFGADSYGFRRVRNVAGNVVVATAAGEAGPPVDATELSVEATVVAGAEPTQDERPVSDSHVENNTAREPLATIDPQRLVGSIVFVSDRSGSLDIWKMAANGEGLQPLTRDGFADADPRFSPTGQQIMYTTLREGFPQIWTINVDGSNSQKITDGSQAAWAPDGESIVFIRDDQTFVRKLATGTESLVTPTDWRRCGVPAWSPDGNQFAVASRHLERIGIFLVDLRSLQYRQLDTEDACCTPHWSEDGSQIVFQTDKGHIHLHYLDDGTEEQVTFGGDVQHDARFSPDGSMIVYCRAPSEEGPWQLWITDLEHEDLQTMQITHMGSNRLPDWHRAGR